MNAPTLRQALDYAKAIDQFANDRMFGHSRSEAMICVLAAEVERLSELLSRTTPGKGI